MKNKTHLPPFVIALTAAILFGASTPACKLLLANYQPALLAGTMYLASGLGLGIYSLLQFFALEKHAREATIKFSELPWLLGVIAIGGVAGPLLLMFGLKSSSASSASLLLNLEGAFTALIAWFAFKENFDRRLLLGMLALLGGGLLLSFDPVANYTTISLGSLAVIGACLCWAIDNNLTRRLSGANPVHIAAIKGCAAGVINCGGALLLGATFPGLDSVAMAAAVGLLGYGISLTLYIRSLRDLGAARATAYFAIAPFIGASVSIFCLKEPSSLNFWLASAFMALGVWLHITENHSHDHTHTELDHDHMHYHDEHHKHEHDPSIPVGEPHSHPHHHTPITHSHVHFPDLHHHHDHQ
jgi:drug/metabolite transporter (DMT)-like permease